MKKGKTFSVGDKVFAKVKGYPAWPAIIIENQTTKYNVKFYGTGETGIVKTKDLFYYLKNKGKFVKALKRKDYNEAIEEIEAAIRECGGSDGNVEDDETGTSVSVNNGVNDSTDSNKSKKRKRSVSSDISDSQTKKQSTVNTTGDSSDKDAVLGDEVAVISSSAAENNATNHSSLEPIPKTVSKRSEKKISESEDTADNISNLDTSTEIVGNKENKRKEKNDSHTTRSERTSVSTTNITIITEEYLKALIAYAEHVKKHEEEYKKKPVEVIQRLNNEVVMAKLPSGKYIAIKYNRDHPPSVDNEYERATLEESDAKTILSLKSLLEEGKCDAKHDPNLFEADLHLTEMEIQQMIECELITRKTEKLKWLKIESNLVELDAKIKGYLGLDKAEPKVAVECLDAMMNLEIDPLMLKKHPHVVDMVKRLRRYIGNIKEWNLSEEEHEQFLIDAENVRSKAEDVYERFSQLFNLQHETLFWDSFTEQLEVFKQQVIDMKESQVFGLSSEPNSRQAFLDRIDEEEEMKLIISKMEKPNKQEKENSSKAANSENSIDEIMETSTS